MFFIFLFTQNNEIIINYYFRTRVVSLEVIIIRKVSIRFNVDQKMCLQIIIVKYYQFNDV